MSNESMSAFIAEAQSGKLRMRSRRWKPESRAGDWWWTWTMKREANVRKSRGTLLVAVGASFCVGVFVASMVSTTGRVWGATPETEYLSENDVAMSTMMKAMAAEPSGDIDEDFVTMMVPHHQGAIDMAVSFLKYGKNDQLRRIAQEIIVDQQQEIAAMKLAIGEPLPPRGAAPTQPVPNSSELPAKSMAPNMKM